MNQLAKYTRSKFIFFCIASLLTSLVSLKGYSKQSIKRNNGRRVVTGVDSKDKSTILSDGSVPENARYGESSKISGSVLWTEHQVPVDNYKNSETLEGYTFSLEPPEQGVTAHILTLEPGFNGEYHQTNTIDFVFIISGKLELKLEANKTILSSGDTLIQRGTNHAWCVIGEEPCVLAAVMISAIRS